MTVNDDKWTKNFRQQKLNTLIVSQELLGQKFSYCDTDSNICNSRCIWCHVFLKIDNKLKNLSTIRTVNKWNLSIYCYRYKIGLRVAYLKIKKLTRKHYLRFMWSHSWRRNAIITTSCRFVKRYLLLHILPLDNAWLFALVVIFYLPWAV